MLRDLRRNLRQQSGSAIIYAMLFAAITGAAIAHFSRMTEQSIQLTRGDKLKSNRDKLRRRLQTMASLDDAIFNSKSRPENIKLKNCLDRYDPLAPQLNMTCEAETVYDWQPFILYGPDTSSPQMTAPSGPNNLLGKYDQRGDPCVDPQKCIFEAHSWFWVECDSALQAGVSNALNPLGNCQASELTLRTLVQVKTIGQVTTAGNDFNTLGKTTDEPRQAILNDPLKRRDLSNKLALSTVTDKKNQAQCKPGYLPLASTEGGVRCVMFNQAEYCAKNQVFIGINSRGEPNCKNVTGACTERIAQVEFDCTLSGCTQVSGSNLSVNCSGTDETQWPGRLTKMVPEWRPENCRSVGGASKKAQPGDIGTFRCPVQYKYRCCNEG